MSNEERSSFVSIQHLVHTMKLHSSMQLSTIKNTLFSPTYKLVDVEKHGRCTDVTSSIFKYIMYEHIDRYEDKQIDIHHNIQNQVQSLDSYEAILAPFPILEFITMSNHAQNKWNEGYEWVD